MRFEAPITIVQVLERIHRKDYVLPAIQREFVWKPAQIERLFDSLMRSYPIGSFLFWDVKSENVGKYAYFDFITNFHEQEPHNQPAHIPKDHGTVAVLDGQQRLTAFNIALAGSYAGKLPRKRWDDPAAFPKKRFYIDLLAFHAEAGAEETVYTFRFLTDVEASEGPSEGRHWFVVSQALKFDPDGTDVYDHLQGQDLANEQHAFRTLHKLVQLIHRHEVVNYYLETSDELDKVLNVFIRVNSGGTVLSYSDLLLSVATAKWKTRDARQEVHELVDQMNDTGQGFSFSQDRIMKAALVLGDFPDIKFKVDNFNLKNMLTIEKQWDSLRSALLLGTKLLAQFGLSGESLTAENVLIPVAYYVQKRGLDDGYLTKPSEIDDRERLRHWVIRSLLRAGFWTGAVDTVLTKSREVISKKGGAGFPADRLEKELAAQGKTLSFEDDEVEDLLWTRYQHRNTFLILTLLYPGIDVSNAFHQDHVFPKALFTRRELMKAGVDGDDVEEWKGWADRLPNLQLLEGAKNQLKSSILPKEWIKAHVPQASRAQYAATHDLDQLPADLTGFPEFWDRRYEAMEERLLAVLGTS